MKEITGQIIAVPPPDEIPTTSPVVMVLSEMISKGYEGKYQLPMYRITRTFEDGRVSSIIQPKDFDPAEIKGSFAVDKTPTGKNLGDIVTIYHILTNQQVLDMFYQEVEDNKKLSWGRRLFDRGVYHRMGDSFSPPPAGYVEHLQEEERTATENYFEYCKYAQKLQSELREGAIHIQDSIDALSLELAGIEESRLKLNEEEAEIKRKMEYLMTIKSVVNKRSQDLNIEYGQAAKERDICNTGSPSEIKTD